MNQIKWTKKYNVYHEKGNFNIFIAEHFGKQFYSSVFYYDKTGSWIKGEIIDLNFKLKTFLAKDEKQAFEQSKMWIANNLPGKYEISESKDEGK